MTLAIRKFGLISDTHGSVHPDVHDLFQGVEDILHAGDVGDDDILRELRVIASVHAVAGNCDHPRAALPPFRIVELPFGKAGIAHGHRQPEKQSERVTALHEVFREQGCRLILHGHSHQQHLEFRSGCWIVNPGAATHPRFGVMPGLCILEWNSETDTLRFDFRPLVWK